MVDLVEISQNSIKKTRDKANKKQTEVLLLTLIIVASAIGSMSLISITCYLVNKKRRNQSIGINKTKKLIIKTKNLPFTDND